MTNKTSRTTTFAFPKGKLICPDGREYDVSDVTITSSFLKVAPFGEVVGVVSDPDGVVTIKCSPWLRRAT